MKLKTKVWLLLGALVGLVLAIDLTLAYQKLATEMRKEAAYDARTIYGFMMATRRIYQQQFVASGLPVNDKTVGFLPAHSFSRISKDFANWNSSGIIFNNVSDRPRNPGNQADRFELEAMDWFRANPRAVEQLRDIVDAGGAGYLLYTAPILIEPFCLKCHGEPADAPPSIRETYATAYGYKLGDLRGVVSIKLPTAKFDQRLGEIFGMQIVKTLAGYALLFFGLGLLLDRLVTRRLARMQAGAEKIAAGEYDARVAVDGRDEVAQMATTFNRMGEELERHREHLEELVAERTIELTAARAEAERLGRAKSEFLANMSHELRTPLNGVLGLARIGARDSAGDANHETFVRIQDSGTHLLGVINDILDFSKLDAGKLHVEQRPFALAAAIDNAISFVSGAAREKGLAFEIEVAADLPQWVSGDAQRCQQILVNLLSNAVKFTERGEVRLRVAGEGENTYFKVIDTGIGMSAEQIARLFQPFEQADSSTTRKYGGTGLGLAISRNLARLMGGEITVDCAPGAGCSFTLRLPLPVADPHLPSHAAAGPAERRLAGLRLLAAEDVEVNRLILEDLLTHEGAQAIFAEDGQQALDRLEEVGVSSFDAVLMDVQMPVLDGLEATRRLRAIAPALPVIGLTAHAFAEERDKCLAAGMAEHVTKPVDPDLLVAAILRQTRPDGPIPSPTLPLKGRESSSSPFKGGEAGIRDACVAPPQPAGCAKPAVGRAEVRRGMELASSAPMTAVPPAPARCVPSGTSAPIAGTLIDWSGLRSRYPGREAFVTRLVTIALGSEQETPAKLRAAAAQPDLQALAFIAHSLKGVGGNLMASAVQELATRTEMAAKNSEPRAAELAVALAAELADQMEALLAELAARVREDGGP